MLYIKRYKGRVFLTCFLAVTLSIISPASPLLTDTRESSEIGPKGGSIMAEDPETGTSVGIYFPEGALPEKTMITLIIHGSQQLKVLGKTHIKGITVIPKGLLLQEKARIEIYNPPIDVTEGMILYRVVNDQFIIPLGSHKQHVDENWIEGTFYITGSYGLGTPTAAEVSAQSKKLASYNPILPLAYTGRHLDTPVSLIDDLNNIYQFPAFGGPYTGMTDEYTTATVCSVSDDEECMRWQKALTKIEAHMTWIEHFIYMNNPSAEQAERNKARDALQEAIESYLKKASPTNRCGSYIKAAAKYLEAATLLGMNLGDESPIAQKFNQLADECSFVFTVETHEWINHPREKHQDGATTEEKSNWYGTIKCHIPWKEFIATGNQKVRGEGAMNLHWINHWVGDEKESHSETNGTWKSDKIEGAVTVWEDEYGQIHPTANITVFWTKKITTHIWGKDANDSYDKTGTDTQSYKESKSYPLKHGYEEKIGNDRAGMSFKVIILKQPGDERDDPNDCF